jgi:hypothetical protein
VTLEEQVRKPGNDERPKGREMGREARVVGSRFGFALIF